MACEEDVSSDNVGVLDIVHRQVVAHRHGDQEEDRHAPSVERVSQEPGHLAATHFHWERRAGAGGKGRYQL